MLARNMSFTVRVRNLGAERARQQAGLLDNLCHQFLLPVSHHMDTGDPFYLSHLLNDFNADAFAFFALAIGR